LPYNHRPCCVVGKASWKLLSNHWIQKDAAVKEFFFQSIDLENIFFLWTFSTVLVTDVAVFVINGEAGDCALMYVLLLGKGPEHVELTSVILAWVVILPTAVDAPKPTTTALLIRGRPDGSLTLEHRLLLSK